MIKCGKNITKFITFFIFFIFSYIVVVSSLNLKKTLLYHYTINELYQAQILFKNDSRIVYIEFI